MYNLNTFTQVCNNKYNYEMSNIHSMLQFLINFLYVTTIKYFVYV